MTMKLRYSPTSPFVRKVTVTLVETGLEGRVERMPTDAFDPATDLGRDNPLGKVPALRLPGGEVLYDSPVICEYLDSLHDGIRLFPAVGGTRWTALRRQALGDGLMDAGVARRLEQKRLAGEQSPAWIERQRGAMTRVLDALEDEADGLAGTVTIGHIALACALGYVDFRFADDGWRNGRPALADWFEDFSARRSMMATMPKDPR